MVTRSQSIKNFNDRMSDLINAKFMVAEKKVSEVLISISDSVLLFELFQHVTEDFDYNTFTSVCFSRDAHGNGCFKLPKTESDVLAFCFFVLMDIDNGHIDLLNLCSEYFPSKDGKQRSYALFATQLLIPFQQITLKIANSIVESEDCEEKVVEPDPVCCQEVQHEETVVKEEPLKRIDCSYLTELKKQCEAVAVEIKKGREAYDELGFALEELEVYVNSKNLRGITLAFTAIKYIKQNTKKIKVDCDKIAKIIAEVIV